jgi:hypothetical protein
MPGSNLSLPFVVAPRSNSCSWGQAALLSLIWLVPRMGGGRADVGAVRPSYPVS